MHADPFPPSSREVRRDTFKPTPMPAEQNAMKVAARLRERSNDPRAAEHIERLVKARHACMKEHAKLEAELLAAQERVRVLEASEFRELAHEKAEKDRYAGLWVAAQERATEDARLIGSLTERGARAEAKLYEAQERAKRLREERDRLRFEGYRAQEREKALREALEAVKTQIGLTVFEGTPVSVWSGKNIIEKIDAALAGSPSEPEAALPTPAAEKPDSEEEA